MSSIDLSKIDPKFRLLTDLLFFSDRKDIDHVEFLSLLKSNYNHHYNYFLYRFSSSCEIFWDKDTWKNRFEFILDLQDASFINKIELLLEKRFLNLLKNKKNLNIDYDIEYIQFYQFCVIKKEKNKDLSSLKNKFLNLPANTNIKKLDILINSFVPIIFSSKEEYINLLYKNAILNKKNIDFILCLENIDINFNKKTLAPIFLKILRNKGIPSFKERVLMFKLIEDPQIINDLKNDLTDKDKDLIIDLLGSCNSTEFEKFHYKNVKNIIKLDDRLIDFVMSEYLSQIMVQETNHKKAKIDKILKLLKSCKEISPKKVLKWLSSEKRTNEIKYLVSYYPDLKKLVAFV